VRLAIPHHQGRISPVFDSAGNVLLIELENGRETRRESRSLSQNELLARAGELLKLAPDVLVCGAISAPLETLLISAGVRVIGFLCGPVDEVVAAFLSGNIAKPEFSMPGCRGWRQRLGQTGRNMMPRGFGMGMGGGGGRGRGPGGGGRGRMGGPSAAGPGGTCVCPKCGEKLPHTVGQPCNQMACPKCGTVMTRA
jgi:predicted Fe-Mo cluster-binding NifX family protein